jgi:hypothetical protein
MKPKRPRMALAVPPTAGAAAWMLPPWAQRCRQAFTRGARLRLAGLATGLRDGGGGRRHGKALRRRRAGAERLETGAGRRAALQTAGKQPWRRPALRRQGKAPGPGIPALQVPIGCAVATHAGGEQVGDLRAGDAIGAEKASQRVALRRGAAGQQRVMGRVAGLRQRRTRAEGGQEAEQSRQCQHGQAHRSILPLQKQGVACRRGQRKARKCGARPWDDANVSTEAAGDTGDGFLRLDWDGRGSTRLQRQDRCAHDAKKPRSPAPPRRKPGRDAIGGARCRRSGRHEDARGSGLGGGQAPFGDGSGNRRPEGRRGAGRGEGDRHLPHRRLYALGFDSEGKFPAILGHEGAGIVREVGAGVTA